MQKVKLRRPANHQHLVALSGQRNHALPVLPGKRRRQEDLTQRRDPERALEHVKLPEITHRIREHQAAPPSLIKQCTPYASVDQNPRAIHRRHRMSKPRGQHCPVRRRQLLPGRAGGEHASCGCASGEVVLHLQSRCERGAIRAGNRRHFRHRATPEPSGCRQDVFCSFRAHSVAARLACALIVVARGGSHDGEEPGCLDFCRFFDQAAAFEG
mmetsp:Transcript_36814/g.75464  ORF Transcript_36814/g.75464 Transcript_36814/m.75464 type:complete len:213 (-) Transcript_36814:1375-2013(-)